MARLLEVVKWGTTLGKDPQTFLGAKWIPAVLHRVPRSRRREWALRIVSLSPHYFIGRDDPSNQGLGNLEYLEKAFRIMTESREETFDKVLKLYIEKHFTVLDYGCGPGFLAKATAPHVEKVFAFDISSGAIECARILNNSENIVYLNPEKEGLDAIPAGSIDAVYSFAVVQHVTAEVFEQILGNCRDKLKIGGKLLLHIQLPDTTWRTEDDWRQDSSIAGSVKFKYGLHCFGRTEDEYAGMVRASGFENIKIEEIGPMVGERFEEFASQRLLTAERAA